MKKVVVRFAACLSLVAAGALLGSSGAAQGVRWTADPDVADRWTCCNLRDGNRWISDANWIGHRFIPAGARVRITGWGRNRAHVVIDGRATSAGVDFGRELETREQFADKIFVSADPLPRIATFPADVRAAIAEGKVRRGMTKEQVIVSLGYPRRDRTPELTARNWVYFVSPTEEFDLDFGADDRVAEIHATMRTQGTVWQPD